MAKEKKSSEMDEGKLYGFLAYLLGIIGFWVVLLTKKDNKFAMYHAKQSLILFIAYIICYIVFMIPVVGWFFLGPIISIILLVLWIIGMVNALNGKEKELPLLGKFAEKINL